MRATHLRTMISAGALALGVSLPCTSDNTTIIYTPPSGPGTFGNDTASTLYLRPLNNAAVGPAAFGSGYPHAPNAYPYPVAAEQSGILRANAYLQNSGWTSWQKERNELLSERQRLTERVQFLEKKLTDIEKQLEDLKKMISSNRRTWEESGQ